MALNNPNDQLEFDLGENEQEIEVAVQVPDEKPQQESAEQWLYRFPGFRR